jgi:hypothetical protein
MISSVIKKKPFKETGAVFQGQAENRGVNDGAMTQEEIDKLELLAFRRVSDVMRRTRKPRKTRGRRRRRKTRGRLRTRASPEHRTCESTTDVVPLLN